MARPQHRGWKRRGIPMKGPTPRLRRPYRPQREGGDLLARLDRLESVVMAIAARLGIDPARPERAPVERHAPLPRGTRHDSPPPRHDSPTPRDDRRAEAGPDVHAVVSTVARKLAGRVKQYHTDRGYGFVVSPDTPGDVFFHRSDCRMDPAALEPSAIVTFDLVEMANGQFKATNLAPRA